VRELSRLKLSDLLFWFLAAVSAVLLAALALILGGAIPIGPVLLPASPPDAGEQTTTEQRATARIAEQLTTPAATTTSGEAVTVVVLAAVHGDSWFSARVGSESGELLDERVLRRGESVRLEAERIWLSIGAAGNIEVTVDGEPKELSGTVSVVLPAPGAATAD
jgi:RodZ C-terminal domain